MLLKRELLLHNWKVYESKLSKQSFELSIGVALQIQVTIKFDQNIGDSIWVGSNWIVVEFAGK